MPHSKRSTTTRESRSQPPPETGVSPKPTPEMSRRTSAVKFKLHLSTDELHEQSDGVREGSLSAAGNESGSFGLIVVGKNLDRDKRDKESPEAASPPVVEIIEDADIWMQPLRDPEPSPKFWSLETGTTLSPQDKIHPEIPKGTPPPALQLERQKSDSTNATNDPDSGMRATNPANSSVAGTRDLNLHRLARVEDSPSPRAPLMQYRATWSYPLVQSSQARPRAGPSPSDQQRPKEIRSKNASSGKSPAADPKETYGDLLPTKCSGKSSIQATQYGGSTVAYGTTAPMSHTDWETAKKASPTDPPGGRYLSRPHAHQSLKICTKEIAGCIMTDFQTDILQGESQLECEDFSEETSEADSPSSCESNSDRSPIKPRTDYGYPDESETSALRFPLESWQKFATSRGSTPQPPASGNNRARIPSTSTASNKRGREPSKGQKRRNDDEEDGSGGKKRRDDQSLDIPTTEAIDRKLACPYYKRSGGTPKAASCVHPGFSSVSRLKEHLYRNHRRPIVCPRCYSQFESQDGLDTHINQPVRCLEVLHRQNIEGFGLDQERQLKSKRRVAGVNTEEDKWRAVYRILFPNDIDIPSPYQDSEDTPGPRSMDFSRWEQTLQDELPRVVRQTLEDTLSREMQAIEQTLRNQLPDIIRNAREQLFTAFVSDALGPIQNPAPFEDRTADQTRPSVGPRSEAIGQETYRASDGLPTADQTPEAEKIRLESAPELNTAPVDLAPQPFTVNGVSLAGDGVTYDWVDPMRTHMQNQFLNSASGTTGLDNSRDAPITPPDDPEAEAQLLKDSDSLEPTETEFLWDFGDCGSYQNPFSSLFPEFTRRLPPQFPEYTTQNISQATSGELNGPGPSVGSTSGLYSISESISPFDPGPSLYGKNDVTAGSWRDI